MHEFPISVQGVVSRNQNFSFFLSYLAQLSDYKGGREKTILTPNLDDLGYLKILLILAYFCYISFIYSNSGTQLSWCYVAQLVARWSVDLMVGGSNPVQENNSFFFFAISLSASQLSLSKNSFSALLCFVLILPNLLVILLFVFLWSFEQFVLLKNAEKRLPISWIHYYDNKTELFWFFLSSVFSLGIAPIDLGLTNNFSLNV